VRLTSFFDADSATALQFADRAWYEDRGIELRTADRVLAIDRESKTVSSQRQECVPYDTLILATGSKPFLPPIEGHDLPGVFLYRTVSDVEQIQKYAQSARSAAVIGGGLLGLEAARALLDLGLETHVVEMASVLMPRQLDNEGAALLREMIESLGVQVHLQKKTQAIRSDGSRRIIEFSDGQLDIDLIVIAAGIRPRDELARESGLDVGTRGGIVVDDQLRTSDANIYAVGECALHRDTIYGLAAPGYHMADVVAATLDRETACFSGSDISTRLKLLGVDVSLCGDYLDVSDAQTLTVHQNTAYRKLILRGRRLVGAVGVGPFPELPRIQEAISKRRRIRAKCQKRFEQEGTLWPPPEDTDVALWPAGAVVCSCVGVSRGELTAACDRGCRSVQELASATGASTVCGSCRPQLAALAGASPEPRAEVPGSRSLLAASVLAALLVGAILLFGPVAWSSTVQSSWYQLEAVWRQTAWKQVSGFSLLGLSIAALLLSLRKRWSRLNFLNFGWWRAGHGVLGVLTIAGLMAHSGMRLGSNLNFWLMATFLGINIAGAMTGAITAMEGRASITLQRRLRQWRPRLAMLHIVCFWPFPVLVAFHIFAAFYL
jgi:nitrite reductase (NADH) large subunit